jgi:hypothetical protein
MDTLAFRPFEVDFSDETLRARLARLRPDDGLAFGLSLAESRRLLAYGGFSLYLATRDPERRRILPVRRTPDRDVTDRAA